MTDASSPMLDSKHFAWDGDRWTTSVVLPSWSGFQDRRGDHGASSEASPSTGEVQIVFAPEGRDDAPLRDSEIALVRWVVAHERPMRDALLEALLTRYDAMRAEMRDFLDDPEAMPPVGSVADFRRLIRLHTIFVHPIESRGIPYAGFQFHCTWEEEHGLGVLMHGTRCVEVGGADTAFTLWVARGDSERAEGA